MLKIKDNVDLKELEKFGLKEDKENNRYDIQEEIYREIYYLRVYKDDRDIRFFGQEDVLFDLIQAGLVEKVIFKEN